MIKKQKSDQQDSSFTFRLSPEDWQLYVKLHQSLLAFVAQKVNSKSNVKNREDFLKQTVEEKLKIRNDLIKRIDLIDEFIKSNPFSFTASELEIIKSWKSYVYGSFFVVNYTEKGATFFEAEGKDPKTYLVLALGAPLWEIIPVQLPAMVEAVLLPFKGRIVYDGLLKADNVLFGGNMARSVRASCSRSVMDHGLVASLPYEKSVAFSAEEKLTFYLGTKENREENWQEIEKLMEKNKDLIPIYLRMMGRANARQLKKHLKDVGVKKGWFAVANDVIVASSKTKEDLEKQVEEIIPNHGKESVYIFKFK
jgi:hypothetical protein